MIGWVVASPLVKIQPLLPRLPRSRRGGRPWIGNRAVIDGILWVLKTGARWCDLPSEYPSPATCWRRLKRWDEDGTWERIRIRARPIVLRRGTSDER